MAFFTRKALMVFILLFAVNQAKGVTAGFTTDNIAGCSPLVVHFTNTSSGATSYYWDLGNATTSTQTDVAGTYITPGTYTVTLTASSGASSDVHTLVITVYPSPTVSFFAGDTSICPGSPVTFTSTTDGGVPGPMTYAWNFGDGFNSTAASPSHTYSLPGYYNVTLVVTNSQGCSSNLTLPGYVHVFTPAAPAFNVSAGYFCQAPAHAVFTNTTTGTGPFTYSWSFGDGGTSTDVNPVHDYGTPGSYTVVLHVTDGNGCTDSLVRPNFVYVGHLDASFTGPSTACVFAPVTFNNTSTTHISSNWSFGDGGTSTADSGTHTYSAPGTYSVRVIVFDGYCYDTAVHAITILPQPTASMSITPHIPCPPPSTQTFTATTSGTSVVWSYGDGGSGSGFTTTHTYTSGGIDTVSMIVTDANGCKDTISRFDTIYTMHVTLVDTPVSGCVPLTVHASLVLTSNFGDYPEPVSTYLWNFGDGSPTSSSPNPAHTYTAVGTYTLTVSATTANGCPITDTALVHVGMPPTVTAVAAPMHVCYHKSVTFTATPVAGPVDVYVWEFGDGSSSVDSGNVITHTFTLPGHFVVTVYGSYHGCEGPLYTFTDTVIVDSPMAIIHPIYNCSPYTSVTFEDISLGDNSHIWFFGDGGNSTAGTVTHNYPAETSYTVTLATYNSASGCRDTASTVVNLVPPVPVIHASDTAVCPEDVVYFSPTVTGGTATGYWWLLNNVMADPDTAAAFYDTFRVRGLYTVTLIVKDEHGCFDTTVRTNYVIVGKPIDTFTVAPPIGCAPMHALFTDLSTDVPGAVVTSHYWVFGDAGTATVTTSTVSHTYSGAGTYSVREIVTDNIGCKDTLDRPDLITVWHPHATFYGSTTYPCIGANVHFTNTSTGIVASFWIFGDGDTSSVNSPDHAYHAVGTYTVKLVVYDAHGCTDTAVFPAYINVTRPHAAFYMDDSFSICPPLSVHFFNTSTGATGYNWNFGDAATSVLVAPSDLYTTSGLYTVMLVASNAYGCKDTAYGHVNLYGYAGAFSYTPTTGCAPLTVSFHADISNVPSVIWDFADGNVSTASTSDSTTHTYTTPGAYVPKLILSDGTGCQNSSLGVDTIKVDGITPGFTTNPHPVCVNSNVTMMDTSTSFFSTITSESWILPDGTVTTTSSPSYFFNAIGSYPVSLSVVDGWGCTGSITENIIVHPPPVITTSPDTTVCVGDAATLSGYGGVSYTWAPAATVSCNPCQTTNATPLVETVYTVTGTDEFGCVNTDTVKVSLRTNTISQAWGDTAVCRHVSVPLYDTGGTKYTWLPAAGLNNNTLSNPIATPAVTTTYMAIAQLAGCIPDTNYVTVTVYQLPTVDAGPNQSLLAGQPAQLEATGTLIHDYMWTPSHTLNCDTCRDPIASMGVTTTYTVTVTSSHGCKASDTVTVYLHCDESQVFIPNSFTPNGDGQNDVFYPRGSGISTISSFRIYNRWGELLFERSNIDINDVSNAWDGSYKGSSPRADVYVYIVDAVCSTGQPINLKGDVTIIK